MEEAQQTAAAPQTPVRKKTNPLVLFLIAFGITTVFAIVMYNIQIRRPAQANRELNSTLVYNVLGLNAAPLKMNERFKDSDSDWVADAPADPAATIDPPKLIFSYVATNEPENYRERFKEFVDYLGKQLGRPVEYADFTSPEAELKALMDGKLHIAGVNTGNIPLAVNECGFVPICVLAGPSGHSKYQMQIIVPADSPMQRLEDLHGHELTLTEPGSNSGFKAPLVLLSKDKGLQPGRDFTVRYSLGHNQSIRGIGNKTYQAAAVASDVLKRAMAQDPPLIKKEQYRVIYESEDFPTAGFGYVCTLKPELAAKVKDAFFSFQWKGTGVEREFAASEQTKFAPVSFKNDFALVRRIDNEIRSVPSLEATTEPSDEPITEPATAPTSAPAVTLRYFK
jgi:phosphonate transport system substrate-binding protein